MAADPGYGANGEYTAPSGATVWEANAPPVVYVPGQDAHLYFALGEMEIPFVDLNDDEAWVSLFPAGG